MKLSCFLCLSFLLSAAVVRAEDAVVALPLVTVTAQKRAEAIESVPVPISAFTGDTLTTLGVEQLDQLALLVPGLTVAMQSPTFPAINLRGLTTDSGDPRSESRVSLYQDGISINRTRSAAVSLFDMERIEVLKGPQGTLFGRGAQIGAISLVQRKPQVGTSGELTLGLGDWGQRKAEGFVNAPLVGEKLLGRVSFSTTEHDGFVKNLADGSRLNGDQSFAVRSALRLVVPDTTVDLIFNVQRDTPPGVAFLSGVIPGRDGKIETFDTGELNMGSRLGIDRTVMGLTLLGEHVLSPAWKLISISGWRQFQSFERFDGDGSRLSFLEASENAHGRQLSSELRAQYDAGGTFTGFAGVNVFKETGWRDLNAWADERTLAAWFLKGAPYNVPLFLPNGDPYLGLRVNPMTRAPLAAFHQENYSEYGGTTAMEAFADGTQRLGEKLFLTLGLRVTEEHIDSGYDVKTSVPPGAFPLAATSVPNDLFAPTYGRINASHRANSWVGRGVARYELTRTTNVYASVSKGRRPPSLIISSGPSVTLLREETVLNYEVGIKGTALGRRLSYDASAFLFNYDHFQTGVADLTNPIRTIQTDAGSATGKGFEASLNARVMSGITLFGTYAFTDTTFDSTDVSGNIQRFAGNTFRMTPRNTYSLGGTFTTSAGSLGQLWFSPSYSWRSLVYFEDDNHMLGDTLKQGPVGTLNLRAGLRLPGGHWEISVYAMNAMDKRSYLDAGNTGENFGDPTFVPGASRMMGVQVTARF